MEKKNLKFNKRVPFIKAVAPGRKYKNKQTYRESPPYAHFGTVLHEIRVSGTVLWSPTNANSPTYTYISQKPW